MFCAHFCAILEKSHYTDLKQNLKYSKSAAVLDIFVMNGNINLIVMMKHQKIITCYLSIIVLAFKIQSYI